MSNIRFDLVLDDKLAKKFREVAQKRGDYKKGALSNAFEQAIRVWLKKNSHCKLSGKSNIQARRRPM
jgi:hypothetical protein